MDINFILETYIKTLIPTFGVFTNGYYDVKGALWLNRIIGECKYSKWRYIMKVGDMINIPQCYSSITKKPNWKKVW